MVPPEPAGPPHAVERVWLALPARHPRPDLLDEARDAVAGLAETLAAAVPVAVLLDADDAARGARLLPRSAERVVAPACTPLQTPLLGRVGPTFVPRPGGVEAVDWRQPPGPDGAPPHDAGVARVLAEDAGLPMHTSLLAAFPRFSTTDGEGTVLVSAALLDPEVNPGWTQALVEDELRGLLGARRVMWLPAAGERTAGPFGGTAHLHAWVRCAGRGEVLVHWQADRRRPDHVVGAAALHALRDAEDAQGRPLRLRTVPAVVGGEDGEAGTEDEAGGRADPGGGAAASCALTDLVPLGAAVLRPAFADPAAESAARELTGRLHPGAEQVAFPLPPLLRLAGGFSDLVLVQPRAPQG